VIAGQHPCAALLRPAAAPAAVTAPGSP
jgi:hypothetical protein